MMLKVPDTRALVAIASALLVIAQQLFPGAHWMTAATAVIGAAVIHVTGPTPPASPGTAAAGAAPDLPATTP